MSNRYSERWVKNYKFGQFLFIIAFPFHLSWWNNAKRIPVLLSTKTIIVLEIKKCICLKLILFFFFFFLQFSFPFSCFFWLSLQLLNNLWLLLCLSISNSTSFSFSNWKQAIYEIKRLQWNEVSVPSDARGVVQLCSSTTRRIFRRNPQFDGRPFSNPRSRYSSLRRRNPTTYNFFGQVILFSTLVWWFLDDWR